MLLGIFNREAGSFHCFDRANKENLFPKIPCSHVGDSEDWHREKRAGKLVLGDLLPFRLQKNPEIPCKIRCCQGTLLRRLGPRLPPPPGI